MGRHIRFAELEVFELTALGAIIEKRHPSLEWDLGICLRCLPRSIGRTTFCRSHAKDRSLVVDVSIEEERLLPHKRNKAAQRRIMGRAFFDFFEVSINKCETKLPGLAGASAPLLADVRQWCLDNRWLG